MRKFTGREYEIKTKSNKKYKVDILMYNVLLHSYVVIEIKIGEYKSEYYGQLKNYVVMIDKELKTERDEKTIGILLCRDGDEYILRSTFENEATPLMYSEYILLDKLDDYLGKGK